MITVHSGHSCPQQVLPPALLTNITHSMVLATRMRSIILSSRRARYMMATSSAEIISNSKLAEEILRMQQSPRTFGKEGSSFLLRKNFLCARMNSHCYTQKTKPSIQPRPTRLLIQQQKRRLLSLG